MSLFENFIFGLPNEIVIEICKLLSLKDLVGLTSVNTELMHIVRTTKWDHVRVTLQITEIMKYIISTYQFVNYDLGSIITNDILVLFKNCHTLDLSGCNQITDETVKMLDNCPPMRGTIPSFSHHRCSERSSPKANFLEVIHSIFLDATKSQTRVSRCTSTSVEMPSCCLSTY